MGSKRAAPKPAARPRGKGGQGNLPETKLARALRERRQALEQQTATAEILRVIGTSGQDTRPVFQAIVSACSRLFKGRAVGINFDEGRGLGRLAATAGAATKALKKLQAFADTKVSPKAPDLRLKGKALSFSDVAAKGVPFSVRKAMAIIGCKSVMFAPLRSGGSSKGAVWVGRGTVGPFTTGELRLLQTFADQAVIAIENARLFNETEEALERQTATAEILKVISASPTATQPVFESIVKKCHALFEGSRVALWLISDGQLFPRSTTGFAAQPMPIDRQSGMGACVLDARTIHLPDLEVAAKKYPRIKQLGLKWGYRSGMYAPLLREGRAIGGISVLRPKFGAFSDKEVALLTTFADQAVIAVENARLFSETKEALEQRTASAEILRVISSSPDDIQPVFDSILEHAMRLCDAGLGTVGLYDGKTYTNVAQRGGSPKYAKWLFSEAFEPSVGSTLGRMIATRQPVHIPDYRELPAYRERSPRAVATAELGGARTYLAIPMLKEGRVLGGITIRRSEVQPFTQKQIDLVSTFANQAVIAIENVRLFNETKEALERQTATSEILGVISSSPTDMQPVFDSILEHAMRLCDAGLGTVGLYDGKTYRHRAQRGGGAEYVKRLFDEPFVPHADGTLGRMIAGARPVHIPDYRELPAYLAREPRAVATVELGGARTYLAVPMLKDGRVLGGITIRRAEVRPFTEKQIELVSTFASQAVIAIENVRLFNETREALERQTATAEILKVISRSPSDVRPVFDAIVSSAIQLVGGFSAVVTRLEADTLQLEAFTSVSSAGDDALKGLFPMRLQNATVIGEAIRAKAPVYVGDMWTDARVSVQSREMAKTRGYRSIVHVPMVRDGAVVGLIHVTRVEPGSFSKHHIDLLTTFADQAVIAIENVRLFNETKEALERQTATAEILKVISSSPTEIQPVFDVIVERAVRLCGARFGRVYRYDGSSIQMVASHGLSAIGLGLVQRVFPRPAADDTIVGRVILTRRPYFIEDIERDKTMPALSRQMIQALDTRSQVTIPMLRAGEPIGAITLGWAMPSGFGDQQVALLQTFADQAVIAIENVRLFKELQERTEALTKSVGQLTALSEVGRAISSTLDPETVLKTIVSRAVQLTGLNGGSIYEFDELRREFHLRAAENMPDELAEVYRRMPIRLGEGIVGGAAAKRDPVQVPDIQDPSYQTRYREKLLRQGYRAILAVPLLRDEQIIGALTVSRNEPGEFAPEVIELLKTFATQSAVAIQNARLFREIAEKSRELELASRHKSQFLASMSHELRTPLNAILGFNEMILGQVYGEVPQDMKEPLEDIQKSGKHLLRLINNVLDLAKIEAGKMELALADYSVQDTVESVRSTLRPLAEAKGLELLASVAQDIPLAYGDGGRLAQCLMNLAGNSLKFTKQGRVEIAVEVKDGRITWRVSDTGIGIPPDKIATLFLEFRQTDATIASEYGGTGLGLSITKKFVEMHGGRIWVESEWGAGSAFMFEVPLRATTA